MRGAIHHGGVSDPTRRNKPPSGTTATRTRRVARHWTGCHRACARSRHAFSDHALARVLGTGEGSPNPDGAPFMESGAPLFLLKGVFLAELAESAEMVEFLALRTLRPRASSRALCETPSFLFFFCEKSFLFFAIAGLGRLLSSGNR